MAEDSSALLLPSDLDPVIVCDDGDWTADTDESLEWGALLSPLEIPPGPAALDVFDEFEEQPLVVEPLLDEPTSAAALMGIGPAVPLGRIIKYSTKGQDVIAIKRALSRAGFMEWGDFNSNCGENMVRAIKAFQKKRGIEQTGQYWRVTHQALCRTRKKGTKQWAFSTYEIRQIEAWIREHAVTPEMRIRRAGVDAARFWIARNSQISYSQTRPFWLGKPPGSPRSIDCSGFVATIIYAAGGRNPNAVGGRRLSWSSDGGQGYTGSLMGGCSRTSRSRIQLLDLVMYGYTRSSSPAFRVGDPTHVAIVIDLNPLTVATCGSSSDPSARYYRYRHDVHSFWAVDLR